MGKADNLQNTKRLRAFTIFYRHSDHWLPERERHEQYSEKWREQMRKYNLVVSGETSFITQYLEIALRSYKIFPCSRLNVFWIPSGLERNEEYLKYICGIGICEGIADIRTEFDPRYFTFTNEQKTKYIIDKVEESLERFCEYFSVDYAPIKEECAKIRTKLNQDGILGPYRIGGYNIVKRDGISARLICYHAIRSYQYYVALSSPVIGKLEVPFFETPPGPMYNIAFGKFDWKDDQTLCLEDVRKGQPINSGKIVPGSSLDYIKDECFKITPDRLLDVSEYRADHNLGKKKK